MKTKREGKGGRDNHEEVSAVGKTGEGRITINRRRWLMDGVREDDVACSVQGVATRFVRRGGSRGRGGSPGGSPGCYGLSGINRWPWRVAKREFDDERRAHQIEAALSVELSPGILGNIFDEIQVSSA